MEIYLLASFRRLRKPNLKCKFKEPMERIEWEVETRPYLYRLNETKYGTIHPEGVLNIFQISGDNKIENRGSIVLPIKKEISQVVLMAPDTVLIRNYYGEVFLQSPSKKLTKILSKVDDIAISRTSIMGWKDYNRDPFTIEVYDTRKGEVGMKTTLETRARILSDEHAHITDDMFNGNFSVAASKFAFFVLDNPMPNHRKAKHKDSYLYVFDDRNVKPLRTRVIPPLPIPVDVETRIDMVFAVSALTFKDWSIVLIMKFLYPVTNDSVNCSVEMLALNRNRRSDFELLMDRKFEDHLAIENRNSSAFSLAKLFIKSKSKHNGRQNLLIVSSLCEEPTILFIRRLQL